MFTFWSDSYLFFPMRGGDVLPFWSSESRLLKIQKAHPKFSAFEIKQLNLDEFRTLLAKLARDGVRAGVNWSGPRLTGYDVTPGELIVGLTYWLERSPPR